MGDDWLWGGGCKMAFFFLILCDWTSGNLTANPDVGWSQVCVFFFFFAGSGGFGILQRHNDDEQHEKREGGEEMGKQCVRLGSK